MSNIDELKEHTTRLLQLLDDPHPGLFTWQEAVHKRIDNIADFHKDPENTEKPELNTVVKKRFENIY